MPTAAVVRLSCIVLAVLSSAGLLLTIARQDIAGVVLALVSLLASQMLLLLAGNRLHARYRDEAPESLADAGLAHLFWNTDYFWLNGVGKREQTAEPATVELAEAYNILTWLNVWVFVGACLSLFLAS